MMRRKQMILLACVSLVALRSWAGDWPVWRGPNGSGVSEETAWDPAKISQPKIVWRTNAGVGHSCISVKGSLLYTMGNKDNQDTVWCLNVKDGSEKWAFRYACPAGSYGGPRATPVIGGDKVYTLSRDGDAYCLAATTGAKVWHKNVLKEFGGENIRWGLSGSPLILGEMVVYNSNQHGVALHKDTGRTMWASPAGKGGYATPVIFMHKGKGRLGIFGEKKVYVVDPTKGAELWSQAWPTSYDVLAADPIYFNGKLFFSSGYGTGSALVDLSTSPPRELWKSKSMKNHFASSIYLDGYLYGIDDNTGKGKVVCLNAKDGSVVWSGGKGAESLMAADKKLIVIDRQGDLFVVTASPAGYQELARGRVLSGKAKNWTAPVLANGTIYCRNSAGDLVAVDVSQ